MTIRDVLNGKRDECVRKALTSDVKKSKHLAIAFRRNGSLISSATNQLVLGNPKQFSIHAEISLINKLRKIKAKERFGNITILVMRFSKRHGWKLSRPCPNCQRILEKYGVNTILFTVDNEIVGEI